MPYLVLFIMFLANCSLDVFDRPLSHKMLLRFGEQIAEAMSHLANIGVSKTVFLYFFILFYSFFFRESMKFRIVSNIMN